MPRPLWFILPVLAVMPACHSLKRVGSGIQAGAGAVSRPVVSGSKKLATATASGTRKLADATVEGAKKVAQGATRMVTFGRGGGKPAPAPHTVAAPAAAGEKDKPLPPGHDFPKTGLLVTEAELGPDATRLEATDVNLDGGWVLKGSEVAYHLDPGATDPKALRVKGSPATAVLGTGETATTASAREFHYHAANQVLTLKGNAVLTSAGTRLSANSPGTLIKIHLPSGAMVVDGPVRWGS